MNMVFRGESGSVSLFLVMVALKPVYARREYGKKKRLYSRDDQCVVTFAPFCIFHTCSLDISPTGTTETIRGFLRSLFYVHSLYGIKGQGDV
jgi:hypothetical protein